MQNILLILTAAFLLAGCTSTAKEPEPVVGEMKPSSSQEAEAVEEETTEEEAAAEEPEMDFDLKKAEIIERYEGIEPTSWGEHVAGVITEINTEEKIVALTFDACIGVPDAFDEELIEFLIAENIPVTLFIGGQWIEMYEEEFLKLAENPLFEIANHGYHHKPLSVSGQSAYGIPGTENVEEVFDEIYFNQIHIKELTGNTPTYFRAGTAYYDEVAVQIAADLGLKTVNYNALGDAGGTFNEAQIINSLKAAQPGSIYLFHMNKPNSDIAAGVKAGVLHLKNLGYSFVQLQEVDELLQ